MFFTVMSNKQRKIHLYDAWECIVHSDEAFCSKHHISYVDSVRSAHQSYQHYYEHPAKLRITALHGKNVFLFWKFIFRSV